MSKREERDVAPGHGGRSAAQAPAGAAASVAHPAPHAQDAPPAHPRWALARRLLLLAFFALVVVLVARQARSLDWRAVSGVLRGYGASAVLGAVAATVTCHLVYSTFDLLGRRWTRHTLRATDVMQVTFMSYVFNHNLGSLVGGVAFRYRLYGRLGLKLPTITRVVTLSFVTNWFGYLLLAGTLFAAGLVDPPDAWRVGFGALRWIGAAMLLGGAAYFLACVRWHDREFSIRGHAFSLPPPKLALMQALLSVMNWSLIGAVPFAFLQHRLGYPTVLATLLVAAIAGVITHIPAGLGVVEAVFFALLGDRVPTHELAGAMIAYRAVFYLMPLTAASLWFLLWEARMRRRAAAPPG